MRKLIDIGFEENEGIEIVNSYTLDLCKMVKIMIYGKRRNLKCRKVLTDLSKTVDIKLVEI